MDWIYVNIFSLGFITVFSYCKSVVVSIWIANDLVCILCYYCCVVVVVVFFFGGGGGVHAHVHMYVYFMDVFSHVQKTIAWNSLGYFLCVNICGVGRGRVWTCMDVTFCHAQKQKQSTKHLLISDTKLFMFVLTSTAFICCISCIINGKLHRLH